MKQKVLQDAWGILQSMHKTMPNLAEIFVFMEGVPVIYRLYGSATINTTEFQGAKPMKPKKSIKSYIYERDGRRCHFCTKRLEFHQASLDHYLPKSKGGTNDIFNLILSCKKCNKLKKSSIPTDFEQVMIELFKIGVRDGVIKACLPQFSREEIQSIVQNVDRIEAINSHVVFQGRNHRLYVKENRIVKVVHLGTQPQPSE